VIWAEGMGVTWQDGDDEGAGVVRRGKDDDGVRMKDSGDGDENERRGGWNRWGLMALSSLLYTVRLRAAVRG